jgi:flagellar hook protein FlgE
MLRQTAWVRSLKTSLTPIPPATSGPRRNSRGFFIVAGADGSNFLTRAGAFTPDGEGNLVNSAGYSLMGYEYEEGVDPTVVVNGFDGLSKVNLASDGLVAKGSTKGAMGANLNSGDAIGTESSTSLSVFDSQGNSVFSTSSTRRQVPMPGRLKFVTAPPTLHRALV